MLSNGMVTPHLLGGGGWVTDWLFFCKKCDPPSPGDSGSKSDQPNKSESGFQNVTPHRFAIVLFKACAQPWVAKQCNSGDIHSSFRPQRSHSTGGNPGFVLGSCIQVGGWMEFPLNRLLSPSPQTVSKKRGECIAMYCKG